MKSQDCQCTHDTLLKEFVNCDTSKFSNGSFLFWSFNCDSSWLTFVSKNGTKLNLFSLNEGLQNLTGRIGYVSWVEYKNSILFQNNVISGSGSPSEYILHNKQTGKKMKNLGRLLYIGDSKKYPIIIGVKNSNYESSEKNYGDFYVYNLNLNKEFIIHLNKGEIDNSLEKFKLNYPEDLFELEIGKNEKQLIINYEVFENRKTKKKTINFDLRNYCK